MITLIILISLSIFSIFINTCMSSTSVIGIFSYIIVSCTNNNSISNTIHSYRFSWIVTTSLAIDIITYLCPITISYNWCCWSICCYNQWFNIISISLFSTCIMINFIIFISLSIFSIIINTHMSWIITISIIIWSTNSYSVSCAIHNYTVSGWDPSTFTINIITYLCPSNWFNCCVRDISFINTNMSFILIRMIMRFII